MADIMGILKKVGGAFNRRGEPRKGVTANETELAFFKERERLDNVKKELKSFRDKENKEVLLGNDQLFKSEYGFDKQTKNIFKSEDAFKNANKKIPSIMGSPDKKIKSKVKGSGAGAFFQ